MAATYSDLAGKTVLVTGGGTGIGEAIVRRFAEQKSKVAFIDIAREPSEKLAAELAGRGFEVRFEHADLTDIAALRAAVGRIREAFGPIRVLINNAAHDERHPTPEVTPEYWDNRIAVNLRHQFFAAQAVLPDMQAAGGGSIVGLDFDATQAWPAYDWMGVAKAALESTARYLARDLGQHRVRVNLVSAGPLRSVAARGIPGFDVMEGAWTGRSPLGWDTRDTEPVAKACVALLSDWFPATTGEIVHVDGGFHAIAAPGLPPDPAE